MSQYYDKPNHPNTIPHQNIYDALNKVKHYTITELKKNQQQLLQKRKKANLDTC